MKCTMKINNKKGFTLIELLVVIAIIGILSTLAVVSLGSARLKARDAKRLSDIRSLQSALEIFNTDNPTVGYPDAPGTTCSTAGGNIESCCLDDADGAGWKVSCTTPLITVPADPGVGANVYTYVALKADGTTTGPNTSYSVNFRLESPTAPMQAFNCLTPAGMTGDKPSGTADGTCGN